MTSIKRLLLFSFCVCASSAVAQRRGPPGYEVQFFSDKVRGYPIAMNNLGAFVGDGDGMEGAPHKAWIVERGAYRSLDRTLGRNALPVAINDAGDIAFSRNYCSFVAHGRSVVRLPGGATTHVTAINSLCHCVGYCERRFVREAFFWDGRRMVKLRTPYGAGCEASAIDDNDLIVGSADLAPAASGHFESTACVWRDGVFHSLPGIGGTKGGATCLNKTGEIGGWASDAAGASRAVLWSHDSPVRLNVPGELSSAVYRINNSGVAVGGFTHDAVLVNSQQHCFVYVAGNAYDLNAVVSDPRWAVKRAWGISDGGDILCTGLDRLTPLSSHTIAVVHNKR